MKKIGLIIGNGKSSQPLVDDKFKSIPKEIDTFGTTTVLDIMKKSIGEQHIMVCMMVRL